MAAKKIVFFVLVINLTNRASFVLGHGRLIEPAARNTAWRYGFDVPANYNENGQNCGGFSTQWTVNGGKCGVCGDADNVNQQTHVYPGKYAKGVITKTYTAGQTIQAKVVIAANHKGWFEFRLGKIDKLPVTQSQLTHLLKLTNGNTRWYLMSGRNEMYTIDLKLPDGLSCDHCVLQWWWKTGNSWGCEGDNKCGLGLGAQETYSNCADVRILSRDGQDNSVNTGSEPGVTSDAGTELSQSEATSSQSDPTSSQSDVTSSQSDATSTQSDATSSQSDSTSTQSDATSSQSDATSTQSDATSTQSDATSSQSDATSTQSDATSSQSDATSSQSGATSSQSEITPAPPATREAPPNSGKCSAVGSWKGNEAMNRWCYDNCSRGYCPLSHCTCTFI